MKKQCILVALLVSSMGFAQQAQESLWLASFNTIKLSGKTSLHVELQLRSTDNAVAFQTILPRVGFNYHLRKNQVLTAGYAYIPNRVVIQGEGELLEEHRFWQQFIVMQLITKRVSLQHRFRFEERILPVAGMSNGEIEKIGTEFTTRLRYFARTILPLKKGSEAFSRGPFAAMQNEIFFNTSNQEAVNGEVFDQNRIYLAFGYRLSAKSDLEFGYMNQYVNRRPYQPNITNHILQLAVYSRL